MQPRLRPLRAAVPFLLAAAVVGGCSGQEGMDVEATPTFLSTAASRSIQATTGRFTMSVTARPASSGATSTSEGRYDTRTHRTAVTVQLAGAEDGPTVDAARMELVVDGSTAFLRSPALRGVLGTDKWVRLGAADLANAGVGVASLADPPTADLDLLRGATAVSDAGHERVRGTKTTRLHATVDVARAVDETPEARRPLLETARRSFAGTGVRTLPVDVWIGGDGLVRRLRLTAASGAGARATVTIDYYGYGDRVRISPPADDEVSKVSPDQLLAGLDGGG